VFREGTDKPGYTKELINADDAGVKDWDEIDRQNCEVGGKGVNTLMKAFLYHAKETPDKPFLGTRQKMPDGLFADYQWLSYGQAAD
jgi:hypothetical protein